MPTPPATTWAPSSARAHRSHWDGHGEVEFACRTNHGLVRTDTVIAPPEPGPRLAGVLLPIVPVRRQIGFTAAHDAAYAQQVRSPSIWPAPCTSTTPETSLLLGVGSRPESWLRAGFSYEWLAAFNKAAAVVAPSLVGAEAGGGLGRSLREHARSRCLGSADPHSEELLVRDGILRPRFSAGPRRGRVSR